MKINRNNYEAFFLDYLEDRLSVQEQQKLHRFLENNPDLKKELEFAEATSLPEANLTFPRKQQLYKSRFDREEDFNKTAVEWVENTLSPEDKKEFEAYLNAHPKQKKEAEEFCKTILIPDDKIVFGNKNSLYRKTPRKALLWWLGRVAAVLVLGVLLFQFINRNKDNVTSLQTAEIRQTVNTSSTANKQPINKNTKLNTKRHIAEPLKPIPAKTPAHITSNQAVTLATIKNLPKKNNVPEIHPIEQVPNRLPSLMAEINYSGQLQIAVHTIPRKNEIENKIKLPLLASTLKKNLDLNHLSKAGLNLVDNLLGDRFSYDKGPDGKIRKYEFNSQILAFAIPVNSKEKK